MDVGPGVKAMDWVEMVGFAGTGLTFAAWAMKGALPLRLFGIASSVAFLSYGALLGSWPVMVTEMVLLPLNAARLWQLMRLRHGLREDDGLGWLIAHGRRARHAAGATLVVGGDVAPCLTILVEGRAGGLGGDEPVLLGEAIPFARRRERRWLLAEGPVEVVRVDLSSLEAAAAEDAGLCLRLARLVACGMAGAEKAGAAVIVPLRAA